MGYIGGGKGRCKQRKAEEMQEKDNLFDAAAIPTELCGARVLQSALDRSLQERIVAQLRDIVAKAPLHRPVTRWGKPMSVKMTAAGKFGWISDTRGYRYAETHPSGVHWPDIPKEILSIWKLFVPEARDPECCLINLYDPNARMGLHQDRDEADFSQPVLSVSLGDEGLFRIGEPERSNKTRSIWLRSGDIVVLEGASRLAFHGVDHIKPGTSDLLDKPGRINLTLRVVT